MPPEPGLCASCGLIVDEADTADALGSGDVPVLGTPKVVALCEQATVAAVAGSLSPGETTVGMRVQLDHLVPTAIGHAVTADAVLDKVQGRRLSFTVSVNDTRGVVAAGRVTRVVVDRDRFIDNAG